MSHPAAFDDIVPPANPKTSAVIRVDFANTVDAADGFNVSVRVLDYQGARRTATAQATASRGLVTLDTATGFDSITGIGTVGAQFIAGVLRRAKRSNDWYHEGRRETGAPFVFPVRDDRAVSEAARPITVITGGGRGIGAATPSISRGTVTTLQ